MVWISESKKKDSFQIMGLSGYETGETIECKPGESLTTLWNDFLENYNPRFWNNGNSYYTSPYWQVGAYAYKSENSKTKTIIGAEYKGKMPESVTLETIPAATWAVST